MYQSLLSNFPALPPYSTGRMPGDMKACSEVKSFP